MFLLSNFGLRTEVCGLDIGPTTLRAAQLKTAKQHAALVAVSEVAFTKKIFDKNVVTDPDAFHQSLSEVMQSGAPHSFTAKAVVAAIPESFVFTRIIQLPHLPPDELRKTVPYEVGQYLPVPVEEVYYDYTPLALRPDKEQIDVALFAAPRSVVDPVIEIIRKCGLELYALETKSTAITRALVPAGVDEGILVIEIGNGSTRLTIIDHGDVWLTASINGGETEITKSLSDKLNIPLKDLARTLPTQKPDIVKGILKTALGQVIEEAVAVTRYHEARDYHPNKIKRALVVGKGAAIPGVISLLADTIHLPTEPGSPLVVTNTAIDPRYTVALGLSMRTL